MNRCYRHSRILHAMCCPSKKIGIVLYGICSLLLSLACDERIFVPNGVFFNEVPRLGMCRHTALGRLKHEVVFRPLAGAQTLGSVDHR